MRFFKLRVSNTKGKPVLGADDLLVLQAFNVAYDTGVFPTERQRIQLLGLYLGLAYTGARPAELVDNETPQPKDGSWEHLFSSAPRNPPCDDGDDQAPDTESRILEDLLLREASQRDRPKALCYEDINLMVVCHPETGLDVFAMAVKFVHHKGADKKPKPCVEVPSLTSVPC